MTYRLSFCELRSLWRGPRFQSPRIGRCLAFAVLMMALAGFVALATSPVVTQLQPRQATNELANEVRANHQGAEKGTQPMIRQDYHGGKM